MTSSSETNDYYVFFSWQSDLPSETNRRLIREALRSASSVVEGFFEELNIRIVIDEATRGEPGSPDIPLNILDKICNSHVFLCDITTINKGAPQGIRKVPNPNVIFELGFAVSQIGWGRIIMLFNNAFGNFPQDAPFDIKRHRASLYTFEQFAKEENPTKRQIAAKKQPLIDLLVEALSEIIKANPDKPFGREDKSIEEIKRTRDITNIKWLFSGLYLPSLDLHIKEAPYKIYDQVFYFWESFHGVVVNSHFHLYDEILMQIVQEMHSIWGKSLSYGHHYYSSAHRHVSFFSNPIDMPFTEKQQQDWDEILKSVNQLDSLLKKFLLHIRNEYLEIDINELSMTAWNDYIAFSKEVPLTIEEKPKKMEE